MEIERKFLVSQKWKELAKIKSEHDIVQFYLESGDDLEVRLRKKDKECTLTLKSGNSDICRQEHEFNIAREDFDLAIASGNLISIDKKRFVVEHEGRDWEVDVFRGDNYGLVLAEIELESTFEDVALPIWLGDEVTGCSDYYNKNLAKFPMGEW